ncbi:MAG: cyclic nucleotide-binding domain-containing protein, partial [Alphaproteobacteria bacterium]|nr:cyclic nucleotide-binding domain-containing protein [Alphaproteobacteria bacterium]
MSVQEKTFKPNAIIFREGDDSDDVFVVVSGRVELSKATPSGSVVLATLGAGDMFGEMGIIEPGPRSATARTVEPCRLQVIPRSEFMASVSKDPALAMRIMGTLVDRLRGADGMIGRKPSRQARRGLLPGLLGRLFGRSRRKALPAPEGATGIVAPPFVVLLAQIEGDTDGRAQALIKTALEAGPGLFVHRGEALLRAGDVPDGTVMGALASRVRHLLAETEADLAVWGAVEGGDSLALHFGGPGIHDDEPGSFSPATILRLPLPFEDNLAALIRACALAAVEPANDARRALQRALIGPAAQSIEPLAKRPPVQLTIDQQRGLLTCHGHAAALHGSLDGGPDFLERAATSYRAALKRLSRHPAPMEESLLHRALASALGAMAERNGDEASAREAVAEWRLAVETLPRALFPVDWGVAQNRLGLALYRLDLRTGETELLREAFAAFQAALQALPRGESRWADCMHNLAIALQVYGDQKKNADVLQRAVEAARAALDCRNREATPLAWAAASNTLGSGLFLLDKHGGPTPNLDEAARHLTAAAEVYQGAGAANLAAVAI